MNCNKNNINIKLYYYLLLIIKSLEFTSKKTKNPDFIELRNSIVKELCFLTETSEDQFLGYLEENC